MILVPRRRPLEYVMGGGLIATQGGGGGAVAYSNTKSLLFDAVDEYLNGGTFFRPARTDAWTLSWWWKPGGATNTCLFDNTNGGTSNHGIFIWTDTGRVEVYFTSTSGSNEAAVRFFVSMNVGQWHHIAVTYDGSSSANGIRCYIDTVQPVGGNRVTVANSLSNAISYATNASIGRRNNGSMFLNGRLDEVSGWVSTALSGAQVTTLYNSHSPSDLSAFIPAPSHWYRCGDLDDTNTLIKDRIGTSDLTAVNMESGDIVSDVPT
jgi:hypothetical protein